MPPAAMQHPSIWWWAFGYLAAYVPYAALTKVVTGGLVDTGGSRVSGIELLPATVMATVVTAFAFLAGTGWWRAAVKPGRRVPLPTRLTVISGLCASGIIATTTLAYTFDATIVFVMLLMRGGVLILAPLIDVLTGRRIRWYSGAALALSIASLGTSVIGSSDPRIPLLCVVDIALYLGFYFVRLQLMSRKAKSKDPRANLRYFVEEQLVSSPALLALLVACAAAGIGGFGEALRAGFTTFFERPGHVWALAIVIGVTSQGTGIFGALILLDPRENTFSIPVNRASSVLAGVVASFLVHAGFGGKLPQGSELAGASIMIAAILVLSFGAAADRLRGPRPAFARRISTAAAAVAAAAVVLGVVVVSRGARTTGAPRDPFVLVLSPDHATPEAAGRLADALSAATGLAVRVRRAADAEEALATAGTASVDAGLLRARGRRALLARGSRRPAGGVRGSHVDDGVPPPGAGAGGGGRHRREGLRRKPRGGDAGPRRRARGRRGDLRPHAAARRHAAGDDRRGAERARVLPPARAAGDARQGARRARRAVVDRRRPGAAARHRRRVRLRARHGRRLRRGARAPRGDAARARRRGARRLAPPRPRPRLAGQPRPPLAPMPLTESSRFGGPKRPGTTV
jgi:hypothetical protein